MLFNQIFKISDFLNLQYKFKITDVRMLLK